MNDKINEILLNFANRIEALPRGKTYGWEDERAAFLSLLEQVGKEIIGEDEPAIEVGSTEHARLGGAEVHRRRLNSKLRATQRDRLAALLKGGSG